MANQSAKVFNIDLKSELLTTLNKNDIKQFQGFNQRNSPILNDGLKHFLKNQSSSIRDNNGNIYELKNNALYKNNEFVKNVAANLPFVKIEEVPMTNEGLSNVSYTVPYVSGAKEFKCIQTTSALYIYEKDGTSYTLKNTINGYHVLLSSVDCLVLYNASAVIVIYNGTIFINNQGISTGLNFTVWKDVNNDPYFLYRSIEKNGEPFDIDIENDTNVAYYYFDLTDGSTSGSGFIKDKIFFDRNNYVVDTTSDYEFKNVLYTSYNDMRDPNKPGEQNLWFSFPNSNTGLIEKGKRLCTFNSGVISMGDPEIEAKILWPNSYQKSYQSGTSPFFFTNSYNYATLPDLLHPFDISFKQEGVTGIKVTKKNTKVLVLNGQIKYNSVYTYQIGQAYGEGSNSDFPSTTPSGSSNIMDRLNYWIEEYITFEFRNLSSEAYFSNYFNGSEFILGGGCSTGADADASFSESFTLDMGGEFKLVYNNNYFANYSWCGKIIENWLSIDDTYSRPIWCNNALYYQKQGEKTWYKAYEVNNTGYISYILNRYILLCTKLETGDVLDLYDTQTNTWYDYACDWDNRVLIGAKNKLDYKKISIGYSIWYSDAFVDCTFTAEIGTGENLQIFNEVNVTPVCSALWQPVIYKKILVPIWGIKNYTSTFLNTYINTIINLGLNENYSHSEEVYLSTTLNDNPTVTTPYFTCIWDNANAYIPETLVGKIFPLNDGNIVFNVPLKTNFETTAFNVIYIYQDKTFYPLLTMNSIVVFAYTQGSGLTNVTYVFCLQGNTYIIQNNIINSCIIQDNVISNVTALISCEGLKYLGATLDVAYFYSEANKNILVFTGDRRLNILTEFNGITRVYKSGYSVPFSTFFLLTNLGLICISDKGYIYILDEDVYTDFMLYTTGINLLSGSWDFYSIYNEGDRVKIKAQTSFYGFGNNQVTIIDTWYIRLYADEAFNGSIKLKVTSLTNKGTESEETELLITADMFDKVTNSYYLRYQPKLQRGVGLSLSIESDYDIIELSCSAIADTTVQLSKPFSKQNVINGGKI